MAGAKCEDELSMRTCGVYVRGSVLTVLTAPDAPVELEISFVGADPKRQSARVRVLGVGERDDALGAFIGTFTPSGSPRRGGWRNHRYIAATPQVYALFESGWVAEAVYVGYNDSYATAAELDVIRKLSGREAKCIRPTRAGAENVPEYAAYAAKSTEWRQLVPTWPEPSLGAADATDAYDAWALAFSASSSSSRAVSPAFSSRAVSPAFSSRAFSSRAVSPAFSSRAVSPAFSSRAVSPAASRRTSNASDTSSQRVARAARSASRASNASAASRASNASAASRARSASRASNASAASRASNASAASRASNASAASRASNASDTSSQCAARAARSASQASQASSASQASQASNASSARYSWASGGASRTRNWVGGWWPAAEAES
jgi:hypothetical protein